jgi:predicted GH43/DUF377 family glycosyl hydrolase
MKIQQITDIFPDVRVARYNLTAWQKNEGDSVYLIGREVETPGEYGQPDTGILKLFEVNQDGEVIHDRVIWKPMFDGINLEDPRALELANENLVIGLTAVLRDKHGVAVPFPAIVKIDSHGSWNQELPPFLVISTFGPGKNLTPMGHLTYLFRPDSLDYYHKILVFTLHKQVPEKIGDLVFPKDLPWATWRIGTTMSPIWLSENEALFIIHGITKQVVQGTEKYIYSIGRAKLTRTDDNYTVTVHPDPILTPDNFLDSDGNPLVQELHPTRRVVYSCGGIIKKGKSDTLSLYVNVGDQ